MQDEVVAFLTSSAGHPGKGPVETVKTHGALIFLAGDVALKIKRVVRYDYMDLSTLALREAMLRRELELNKPVAPKIYQDVIPVTRARDGGLELNGDGEPVEWVLRMWRFPKSDELATIADAGGVDDALADTLGASIFAYHARAPQRDLDGATLIRDILDELDRVFADMKLPLGAGLIDQFHRESRAHLRTVAPLLQRRADAGHVRRCHGDLHLGNLVLLDGKPVPFDALEFDEVLGTCDVLYDLAFLIMDLTHRKQGRASNMVLNAYLLAASGREDAGLAALPLFLAVRAAIRAMVTVQTSAASGDAAAPEAVELLQAAMKFMAPPPPSLVLIGGVSGTGKTAVSRAIAPLNGPVPGAVHLRSDLERRAMRGLDAAARLPAQAYCPSARDAVYERIFQRAKAVLNAGHAVLIDATFLDMNTRSKAAMIAKTADVPLHAIWLEAPLPVLLNRVRARSNDASDADETVVRHQLPASQPPSDWTVLSAAGSLTDTISSVTAALHLVPHG